MVHREKEGAESPTLSCSSSSSEEELLKQHNSIQTTTTTTRIGRIIHEHEDEDEEDVMIENGQFSSEAREEVLSPREQALLDAIESLNRLASMDSTKYQQRLVDNKLPPTTPSSRMPEHPSVSKLTQSIHRFHSMMLNVSRDYDQQTSEIVELQTQFDAKNQRIAKLEKAVSKLHSRNLKLQDRSQKDKSMATKLMEQVQKISNNAAKRKSDDEFYELVNKVQQHEQVLRERTDSNFSESDGLQDFDNRSVGGNSVTSTQSLVTDDGVATLKIQRERTLTWPNMCITTTTDDDVGATAKNDVPAEEATTAPSPKPTDSNNPFAMFMMAPKIAQPYTLTLVAPFSLQFVILEVDDLPTAAINTNEETLVGTEPPSVAPVKATAFAVCGYHGFDSTDNFKPTLGARLLAINKEAVNPSWSVPELEAAMADQGKYTSLTFRNDAWNKNQKEALHLSVQEQERLHPSQHVAAPFLRIRTQSGDRASILGFLNFNHHSPKGGEQEAIQSSSSSDSIKEEAEHPETPKSETQEATLQTDRASPLNNVMSSFWKSNSSAPERSQEEAVSLEEPPDGDGDLPLPEEASSDAVVVKIPESKSEEEEEEEEEQDSSEAAGRPSSSEQRAAEKFKSSMKNMGKLFAFR
jgi:hypothetical protein